MPNTQLDRRPKNTQLDRRVRYAQLEERPSRGWKGFSSIVEGPAAWLTSFLLIPCLIVVALLLPPVNLWDRLQVFAYTRIGSAGGVLTDPDGTLVSIPPEGVAESFYANFSSIPRVDFIEGQAGRQFYDAAVALQFIALMCGDFRRRMPLWKFRFPTIACPMKPSASTRGMATHGNIYPAGFWWAKTKLKRVSTSCPPTLWSCRLALTFRK